MTDLLGAPTRLRDRVIDLTDPPSVIDLTDPAPDEIQPGPDLHIHLIDAARPDPSHPAVRLHLRATELTGAVIEGAHLRAEAFVDLERAVHPDPVAERLIELFGLRRLVRDSAMYLSSTRAVVPAFGGTTSFDMRLPLPTLAWQDGHDYLGAVTMGDVALRIDFEGTVTVATPAGPVERALPDGCCCRFELRSSLLALPASAQAHAGR